MKWALLLILLVACQPVVEEKMEYDESKLETATFAGGCFWCIETPFKLTKGVIEVTSGYSGGDVENPTYKQVTNEDTGHRESVQILFDPSIVTYETLLETFWIQIDPTDEGGQFSDRGFSYTTAIFYHSEEQKLVAEKSKQEIAKQFEKPIATKIIEYKNFYPAEEYHQDYAEKNPLKYNLYKKGSGRSDYIKKTWGEKLSKDDLKEKLTEIQYHVTQENGTEKAFNNEYWDNKEEGIYVDIVSGEPLFSSTDKYKSGTGWPSFTKPLVEENIVEREDKKLFVTRTELRSAEADSHLGHVFNDGPEPTGERYCINSAALRFIPKDKLEEEGYGEFLSLFD